MPIESLAGGAASGKDYKIPKAVQEIPDSGIGHRDGTVESKNEHGTEAVLGIRAEDKTAGETAAGSKSDREARPNEQLKKAADTLSKQIDNSEAIFGIHDETKRITIKIVDKDTKKMIKEFPPEKALDLLAKAWEMAGIMVDEKR